MSTKSDFINNYRQTISNLIHNLDQLQMLRREFIFQNYTTTMTDADFAANTQQQNSGTFSVVDNSDLVKQDLLNASSAVDAIEALLTANTNQHYGRLYKLKRD